METDRLHLTIQHYRNIGRRSKGSPLKKFIDPRDRKRPGGINSYDDDNDDHDDDDNILIIIIIIIMNIFKITEIDILLQIIEDGAANPLFSSCHKMKMSKALGGLKWSAYQTTSIAIVS